MSDLRDMQLKRLLWKFDLMELHRQDKIVIEQLGRWVLLMQQVHEAKHYIEKTERLAHPQLMQTFEGIWDVLLPFRGAIVSYAKCFATTGPGRIKLEEKHVFGNKTELVNQHRRIMELRNKYVAHSDDNEMESTSIETIDKPGELLVSLQYRMSFPFDRMYELRELIKHLDRHIADGLERPVKGIEGRLHKPVRIRALSVTQVRSRQTAS
jgi:hypothetical protein